MNESKQPKNIESEKKDKWSDYWANQYNDIDKKKEITVE